jgi:hypothetical protein
LIFRQLSLPFVHFWDRNTSAFAKISILYSRGANYEQEDVVCHAWGEICALYFPKIAASATAPRWSIEREAYRGNPPLNPSQVKPDPIVVRFLPTAVTNPNFLPFVESRDFLWIECKAATENTPSGWKNALGEAATRLNNAHPDRMIYLIIAIGWRCAFFVWDPTNTMRRPKIFIRPVSNQIPWLIDQRIKFIGPVSWIDPASGEFDHTKTIELECFWQMIENGLPVLANHHNLEKIEQFLVHIQNSALQGRNPSNF